MAEPRLMSIRLKSQLLEWVREQGLRPGDRFLTEVEVMERWGVGRSTAREALRALESDGILLAEQGRGRFLSASSVLHVDRPVTTFESATSLLAALGYEDATTTVLSVVERPSAEPESTSLEIPPGTTVVVLERLRALGEEPLLYSVDIFPKSLIPGPTKHVNWSMSLSSLLAANGHPLASSAARLEATELPSDVAERYSLGSIGPWLLITETVLDTAGARVLFAQDYHRGSHFAFKVARR